ncbi:lanthionine synthetase LanC family protein [Dolosigranulum pigrum]|uniref:Lantibiotic biosynthesis protein dehydration domain-containing protein n=1 Tax=Dolosigranulum pigrum ATCC 51524 TaxID=883103 RepID=H3NEQ0_9LACT|nr:lanthionine synthetase LanC family protein [Dolosigranulum pigrum]EHR32915.1 hypothetical protein HMPREF9703_01031 [Dolosigranulum pigrum ATCC 51524]
MGNTEETREKIKLILNNIHDNDYSLNNGNVGKLLLLDIIHEQKYLSTIDYMDQREKVLKYLWHNLKNNPIYPGIFDGISGVGLYFKQRTELTEYEDMIYQYTLNKCSQIIEKNNHLETFVYYELYGGLIGCGKVLLGEKKYANDLLALTEKLVLETEKFVDKIMHDRVAYFFIENGIGINATSITYNLGLSHGLAGLLSFLIDFYEENKENRYFDSIIERIKKAIDSLLLIYMSSRKYTDDYWYWNDEITLIWKHKIKEVSTFTWCRGMVGISTLVYKGFKLLGKEENAQNVRENIIQLFNSVKKDVLFENNSICHGSFGIIYTMMNKFNYYNEIFTKELANMMIDVISSIEDYSFLQGELGSFIIALQAENLKKLKIDTFLGY